MKMKGIDTYEKPEKDPIGEFVDKIAEFVDEMVTYLHSWCCTRNGRYEPVDYRSVKLALISLLNNNVMASREQSHKANAAFKNGIIDSFKNGIINGNVAVQPATFISAISLPDFRKTELYEKHRENVRIFEEKYNIKHEENK